jgi:hypothetical protein
MSVEPSPGCPWISLPFNQFLIIFVTLIYLLLVDSRLILNTPAIPKASLLFWNHDIRRIRSISLMSVQISSDRLAGFAFINRPGLVDRTDFKTGANMNNVFTWSLHPKAAENFNVRIHGPYCKSKQLPAAILIRQLVSRSIHSSYQSARHSEPDGQPSNRWIEVTIVGPWRPTSFSNPLRG